MASTCVGSTIADAQAKRIPRPTELAAHFLHPLEEGVGPAHWWPVAPLRNGQNGTEKGGATGKAWVPTIGKGVLAHKALHCATDFVT